ncbi:MAG: hypothetical protein QOG53_3031 [Frankiales bacterium]|jgi:hypothetical protein|nr:hypothetical protein [Frankiales bacterium]
MTSPSHPTPLAVRVAASLVALQGVALVAGSLTYAGFLIAGEPDNRGLALFGAAIGLLFGGTLVAAARGLSHRRRPAYSPTVLIELLSIPVGIGLIQSERPAVAVAVLVPSVLVLGLLIGTPGGRSVLAGEVDSPD